LMAVAKSALPEADGQTKRALAAYALTSAKYLAAIEAIAKRARYIAAKDGRASATTDDVRRAMKESVIPADSKLVNALKTVERTSRRERSLPVATPPAPAPSQALPPRREVAPPEIGRNRITGGALELAEKE
jgi:histone H3/H4